MTDVRVETAPDHAAVEAVHAAAFGDEVVPALVAGLRRSPGLVPAYSLVADDGPPGAPDVVGHVMLTRVPLEALDGTTRDVLCLSPLAVRPDAQGRGLGRTLVEAACAAADAAGEPFVVLEGDPRLYARFGFVPARTRGLRRPSERTPEPAFQVRLLAGDRPQDPGLHGRVLYPDVFWSAGAVGLPMDRPAFLDALERACRVVEQRCRTGASPDVGALVRPVPACPGWTVADVVRHLGFVHRFVAAWVDGGRRPRAADRPDVPAADADPAALLAWFGAGWRNLQEVLDARGFDTPTVTWSPWDATAGFWYRRMAHEAVIHAVDVVEALPHKESLPFRFEAGLPEDGIDEVVRLWLGTRLGADVGGDGDLVRLVSAPAVAAGRPTGAGEPLAGQRLWTVGLHGGSTETHDVATDPDATVAGTPESLYRWLWGRGRSHDIVVSGSERAVAALRAALRRAMQ